MDAPLTSLDDRVVSDVAQQVSDGDVLHKILTVFFGVIGGFLWFRYRQRIRTHRLVAGLLMAYLAWICVGVFNADDPGLTVRRLGGFSLSLILCAGCAARMDADSISFFIAAIPTLTILPDIIAELKSHGLEALTPDGRFGGTYPHPNVAAAALAIPLIVFIWFALRTRGLVRVGYCFLSLIIGGFFLLTRSRTSLVAALVAIAFSLAIIVIRNQRENLARLLSFLVLFVGVTGLAGLVANSSHGGLNLLSALQSSRDEGDPTTLTGRVDLWKTVLDYAYERPVFGYGFGGFWSAKHIETISEEQKWPINQSHSAYIDQILSLGFPGAALYVLLIAGCLFVCAARFFRYKDEYGVWAALLVFVVVNGLTEAISLAPGFLSFVLSLITVQIALIKPTDASAKPAAQVATPAHKYSMENDLYRGMARNQRRGL